MWKIFTLNGNYKWVNKQPRLVSDYKHACKHRTIGMRPTDITSAERLGHSVQRDKDRGYYKIHSRRFGTREQVQDDLKSVAGEFYEHELHCATHPDEYLVKKVLRRKGDKVYIK
ncbi:PREDICTED: uncharacterized protein LOC105144949 [Acromyrmex echinatior]|uniref:uncharacterized protein LOC105144949 n=1 Tax=Acromyrmex echinatior TaxID=103372 RepID=UPI000580C289|nr:PREDICTED: uncharacterized protein LOC105144949 [Acromyrmex echinatior]